MPGGCMVVYRHHDRNAGEKSHDSEEPSLHTVKAPKTFPSGNGQILMGVLRRRDGGPGVERSNSGNTKGSEIVDKTKVL